MDITFEIALTLGILSIAVFFFITEKIRSDLTALFVLVALVVTGLVTPDESISGFSNPAVVTIWSVFILSGGLARTGVASLLGREVLRIAGKGFNRLIAVLMGSTAFLSAFMNNIGVAAMFLPVTLDMARRTGRSPSLLLMPMAYGSLFGGMLVLIGTSTNLIVSDFLRETGFSAPGLFDFTPVGAAILAVAVLYMVTVGRKLLPSRKNPGPGDDDCGIELQRHYSLPERFAVINITADSPLAGRTLAESRFGRALGINVLKITRKNGIVVVPDPGVTLEAGDTLLVLGRLDAVDRISGHPLVIPDGDPPTPGMLVSEDIGLAQIEITEDSRFSGKTVVDLDARQSLGVNILAIRRKDLTRRTNLDNIVIKPGDLVLLQGKRESLESLREEPGFMLVSADETEDYRLHERLLFVKIPQGSPLGGSLIKEARLPGRYGISVLGILRESKKILMPEPSDRLKENDIIIAGGRPGDIEVLRGHQTLKIERSPATAICRFGSESHSVVEVMLSPYTSLAGKNLRELSFREKFGVTVLAVWRRDRSYRTGLADFPLEFGDALLCYGPDEKFPILARERDFVVLKLEVQEKPNVKKAPAAGLIMAGVVASVVSGWLPIHVAAIGGAAMMVLTGCLTMNEAYKSIEWKAVFLIAAMMPMGLALKSTGAADLFAGMIAGAADPYGPRALLAGIMFLAMLINQVIPATVNAVVMAPVAIAAALTMGISPYPLVMGVAYAVAASFMSPLSHPANVLIMSPGGYKFTDYIKNGLPLSIIVFVISVLLVPVFFPF